MPGTAPPAISQLLARWREGDHDALRALVPLLYDDLRRVAHQNLRKVRPRVWLHREMSREAHA